MRAWPAVMVACALSSGCGARTGVEDDARAREDRPERDAGVAGEPDAGWLGLPPGDAGPPPPPPLHTLSAGYFRSCVVRRDELLRVWCWGVAAGICLEERCEPWRPRAIEGSDAAEQLSAGGRSLCTRQEDGTARCAPGPGAIEPVPGLSGVVQVSTDGSFRCAVVEDGRAACWGDNTHGQLGSATAGALEPEPVWVDEVDDAVDLDAGQYHACAVRRNGRVLCWGENQHGQLGDGTRVDRRRPIEVERVADIVSVTAGDWHTCALRRDRRVICWGSGWLGDGGEHYAGRATVVPGLTDVVQIGAGGLHTCARLSDGRVRCWGLNESWQAGGAETGTAVLAPSLVEGVTGARDLAVGLRHNCVDEGDERILCWGSNSDDALGRDARHGGPVALPVDW